MSGEKANWDGIKPKDLPGYPWLPCPICKREGFPNAIESCDHTRWERARAAHPSLHLPTSTDE